jgi:hypothetical protein
MEQEDETIDNIVASAEFQHSTKSDENDAL